MRGNCHALARGALCHLEWIYADRRVATRGRGEIAGKPPGQSPPPLAPVGTLRSSLHYGTQSRCPRAEHRRPRPDRRSGGVRGKVFSLVFHKGGRVRELSVSDSLFFVRHFFCQE